MRFPSFFHILEAPDLNIDPEISCPGADSAFLNIQTAILKKGPAQLPFFLSFQFTIHSFIHLNTQRLELHRASSFLCDILFSSSPLHLLSAVPKWLTFLCISPSSSSPPLPGCGWISFPLPRNHLYLYATLIQLPPNTPDVSTIQNSSFPLPRTNHHPQHSL